jgi:hypothetical protein
MGTRIPTKLRDAILQRDSYQCQRCGRSIYGIRYSLHHRRRKGMGGSRLLDTMANLVVLEGTGTTGCHGFVHTEASWAASYGRGWLVPNGVTPKKWPVRRFGRSWEQPGELWILADPHPQQMSGAGINAILGTRGSPMAVRFDTTTNTFVGDPDYCADCDEPLSDTGCGAPNCNGRCCMRCGTGCDREFFDPDDSVCAQAEAAEPDADHVERINRKRAGSRPVFVTAQPSEEYL